MDSQYTIRPSLLRAHRNASLSLGLILLGFISATEAADPVVNFPAPNDSGWIKLFRGDNLGDFYSHLKVNEEDGAWPNNTFKAKGDTIQCMGNPTGHLAFKQFFSYYHIRYQILHVGGGNAGMLLHIREKETPLNGLPIFPRSMECQGQSNALGDLWTISDVVVDIRVLNKNLAKGEEFIYKPDGELMAHGLGGRRWCRALRPPNLINPVGQWNTVEAFVYGADSIRHVVNGVTVIRYSNIRVATNATDMKTPLNNGRIGWQSEGPQVLYRNLEIKLFPQDPIYNSVYKPVPILKMEKRKPNSTVQMERIPKSYNPLGRLSKTLAAKRKLLIISEIARPLP